MSEHERAEALILAIHRLHKPDAYAMCSQCLVSYPCPTARLITEHVHADGSAS